MAIDQQPLTQKENDMPIFMDTGSGDIYAAETKEACLAANTTLEEAAKATKGERLNDPNPGIDGGAE